MKNLLYKIRYLCGVLLILLLPLGSAMLVQIQRTAAATTTTPSTPIGIRIVGSKTLNIRSNPGHGNNIIGHFNQGDRVNVIEKDQTGKWCRVDYQNRNDAWVYCKGLRKEKPADSKTAPATLKPSAPKKLFRQTYHAPGAPTLPNLTANVSKWSIAKSINGLTFSYPPELNFFTGPVNKNGAHYYVINLNPRHIYLKIVVKSASDYDSVIKNFNSENRFIASGEIKIGNVTGKKYLHGNTLNKQNPRTIIVFKNNEGTYVIDNWGNDPNLLNQFLSSFKVQA